MWHRSTHFVWLAALLIAGCAFEPGGTKQERDKLTQNGKPFEPAVEKRQIADLPQPVTWQSALERAFLTNGELEAAYFDWKAALSRVTSASTWPNSNLSPSFSWQFSGGRMKALDRTMVSVAFDPMQTLLLPNKQSQTAKVALEEARVTGAKFMQMKFAIQRKTLDAYLDLALMDEQIRIQSDSVDLLKLMSDSAAARLQAGGMQIDLSKAQIEHRLAQGMLETMKARRNAMVAMLNAMLGRDARANLVMPTTLPTPRDLPLTDDQLLAVAVTRNPELSALAHDVQGKQEALELAKMAWLPDISPSVGFNGSMSQSAGLMLTLPTAIPRIKAQIEESRAMLRSAQAMARQTRSERAASFVVAMLGFRDGNRQSQLLENTVLPQARQAVELSRQSYSAGSISFIELLDAQRTLLETRRMLAETRIEREKRLAEIEQLAGVDIETLSTSTTQPATHVTTQKATADGVKP